MRIISLVTLLFALFLTMSCSTNKVLLNDVALQWRPKKKLNELARFSVDKIAMHKIKLVDLKDNRKGPLNHIGENAEDATILPVNTSTNVAVFVSENLRDVLRKMGLEIVETGEEYTLSGSLNDFNIHETNDYIGQLLLKLQLQKGDKQLWSGVINGSSSIFGRSYKMENYNEAASDAIIDAAQNLLRNDDFQNSF